MDLNNKTNKQLILICKKNKYKGYSGLKKNELINFIFSKNNDYKLINLVKSIKNSNLLNLMNKYSEPSKKGYLYEKLWDIIIKCGYCLHFNNSLFQHMDGNINLGKMDTINDIEYYFMNNKTFSKNKGGSSDITLKKNDGTWIFISSKFYKDDNGHSIKDYEIQDILKEIQEHKHYYKKYEIWLFVNDKNKVNKIIKTSHHTNDTISKNINGILDFKDLEKYYINLQKELHEINLDSKGELNNRFCNSMEIFQERFHQDLLTFKTINMISEGEQNLLWGWKCRAGKTYGVGSLLLKYYKKFNKCNCLIITPAPTETISQFVNDMFNRYRDFNKLNIIEVKGGKELKSLVFKNNNIIVCSKQLLDDYITDDTKIQNMIDLHLDLIIFDENHFGGCSKLSKQIISTYSYKNTIKLYLTATFQKPLSAWNIPKYCQFYWNIEDEQLCKKRNIKGLVDKHGDEVLDFINEGNKENKLEIYDNMPNLELITTMMDSHRYNIIREQIKDTKFGFSMEVLFSLTKNKKFNYPKEVENILSYISGSSMGAVKDKKSIFERIKTISINQDSRTMLCNENFTTQLWFLPFGQGMKINNVSNCLKGKMLNDIILQKYSIMIINSHKEYKLKDLKGDIYKEEQKAKAEGKLGLILLAGNQCSLGITLPLCDIVVLLNNTLSVDRILQMMYRCMSESSDGSKKCGYVVDLNISRVLNTLLEYNINKKDTTIKDKFTYLIENNLINIDSDLFVGKEKETKYGVKLINKLLDIWKSDPINNHKRLLKKIENLVIDLEIGDQLILNKYFTTSGKSNNIVEIKLDEDNEQDLSNGKEIIKVDNKDKIGDTDDDTDDDDDNSISVSLTKDILPFVIPLSCILTINDNQMDFIQMLDNIKQNEQLLEVFNTQSNIWWNKRDIIDLIRKIVNKYLKKNTEPYNIAIQFKMSLQSLIDRPTELLELIDSCLKPKQKEKQENGEVFTPMKLVNEMLDELDKYYIKENNKSIFEEKKLKWLDPANGMGNFPIGIYYRLMDGLKKEIDNKEERKKHILENMLYMSEFNKKNVYISKQIFDIENKYKLNIYCGDSLKLDTENEWGINKFDIVIGNPPYNTGGIRSHTGKKLGKKNKTIWPLFIKQAFKWLKPDGYLAYINPLSWLKNSHSLHKIMLEKHIIWMKLWDNSQSKRMINADIPISFCVLQNTKNIDKKKTKITSILKRRNLSTTSEIYLDKQNSISLAYHDIFDKLINFIEKNNLKLDVKTKTIKSEGVKFKLPEKYDIEDNFAVDTYRIKDGIMVKKTKLIHPHLKSRKLIISNKSSFRGAFIDEGILNLTGNHKFYILDENLEIILKILSFKISSIISQFTKYGQDFLDKDAFSYIPDIRKLGIQDITEKEFYKLIGFSDKDISIINKS
tara:strand:- start:371 stop:4549 length:4179 start_codon:yes stop_codon:yes gene_type:complete